MHEKPKAPLETIDCLADLVVVIFLLSFAENVRAERREQQSQEEIQHLVEAIFPRSDTRTRSYIPPDYR